MLHKSLVTFLLSFLLSVGSGFAANTKAKRIRITDAKGYYTSTNVEGALEEVVDLASGSSFNYFLSDTNSDISAPVAYEYMYPAETEGGASSTTPVAITVDDTAIEEWITEAAEPTFTILSEGIYILHTHAEVDIVAANYNTAFIYWELWKHDSSHNETLLITGEDSSVIPATSTAYILHGVLSAQIILASTDRLVLKVLGSLDTEGRVNDPDVTIHMEGTNDCHFTVRTTIGAFDDRYVEIKGDVMTGTLDVEGLTITTGNPFTLGTNRIDDTSDKIDDDMVAFDDGDSNWTATDVGSALEELDEDSGGSAPNQADYKVNWNQIGNMPAGFADGTDATGALDIDALGEVTSDDLDWLVVADQSDGWALKKIDAAEVRGGGAEVNDLETTDPPNVENTEIYIGTGSGAGAWAAMSGEATMDNTGAVTLADSVAVASWNLTTPIFTTTAMLAGILQHNGDMVFECDADNDGSNKFSFTDGAATEVLQIDEAGNLQLDGDILIDGTNIGITADTNLVTLASDLFTVNGEFTADMDQNSATEITVINNTNDTAASAGFKLDGAGVSAQLMALGSNYTAAEFQDKVALYSSDATAIAIMAADGAGVIEFYTGGVTSGDKQVSISAAGILSFPNGDIDLPSASVDLVDLAVDAKTHIFSATIYDPDGIQGTVDAITIFPIEAEAFPNGVTFSDLGIKTNAASSYTVVFEEWTDPTTHANDLESVATSASTEAEDDGTIGNGTGGAAGDCDAGSIIKIDLPDTDIDELEVWGVYTINES